MDNPVPPIDGDRDRGAVILGVTWALTLSSLFFVSLRMYTRAKIIQRTWWDDWLAVIAIALATPLPIIWIFYVDGGGARHVYYLSPGQRVNTVKINWMSQPFGIMAIAISKASVAFSILRFQSPNKWRTRVLYFIASSIFIVLLLTCIFTFAQCSPPRALWTPELLLTTAKCWPSKVFIVWAISASAYSASLDFVLVFISTTIIWKLQLSVSRRLQLAALLGTGILDGIFGIIKCTSLTAQSARSDYIWNTYPLFLWTIAEIHGIIIGSCLPTLRPLYLIVFRRPGRETYSAKGRNRARHYGYKFSVPGASEDLHSRTRQAKKGGLSQSAEEIFMPGIRQTVDMNVSFEASGQSEAHEGHEAHAWPANTSVYHTI